NRTFQAAELESRLEDQELRLAANGVFDDPDSPRTWNGTLTELSLAQPSAVDAEGTSREIFLVQSAPIALSSDSVTVERACLQGSIEARLCVAVDWMAGRRLEILAELDAIAVDRVNQFVATGFVFDQHVTGQMRWDKAAGAPLTAFADLEISPGTIRSRDDPEVGIQTGEGLITFDVREGTLLEGDLRLPLPGTGNVEGTFSLADISDLRDSAITGRLDAELSDMTAIRMFVPSLERADGHLTAKVSVDGTVQAPVLTGNVALRDGALAYRPIGLELEDIELDAAFGEGRQFELTGSFLAGEGRGTVASSGVYGNGFREDLVVTLEGERLRLIDVPDLTAVADADVRVGFDDGIIRLDGEIVVPHARISPRNLLATRHSESADVVVVAGERETAPEDPVEQEAPVLLDGKLGVGLGDDVIVDIDLAEAQVTGSVEFTWDRSLMPVANGRYEVSGDVQVYGQVLDITEGTIRFPNVPANDPYLRVRAEREIFGNSQIKSAGILVDGTLRRPTVEPYTEPRTTRERALTLLVTGSDFDLEQGVGAIDFGTYIAPRLFVSYGIGLFDQENVISARYDLGKGFGVKATSGQSESGIDLIYHVER
ncbi:MAG TPA: translocation/assembly module TamB domain-containing protein, partial [Woeseiaceae bacterium]|nr:translocation/assembly module TamB domain-containing protein [Woeseiaceae bacterium]